MKKLTVFCDGGARGNPGPAASAFIVFDENGKEIIRQSHFIGKSTNNIAEYKAVYLSLDWLASNQNNLELESLLYKVDSLLVVKQLRGEYKVKNFKLLELKEKIKRIEKVMTAKVTYNYIPREENTLADSLVNNELDAST